MRVVGTGVTIGPRSRDNTIIDVARAEGATVKCAGNAAERRNPIIDTPTPFNCGGPPGSLSQSRCARMRVRQLAQG